MDAKKPVSFPLPPTQMVPPATNIVIILLATGHLKKKTHIPPEKKHRRGGRGARIHAAAPKRANPSIEMFSMSSRTSRSITTTTIIVVPSPSALFCPLPILALLLLCLAQQRTTMMADAFLLSHRNLLLPFASSKGAAKMTGMDKDGQGEDRLGALVVDQQEGEKVPKMPMRLLGFMALPKSAVEALRRQMDGVEKGGGRMERTEEEGEKREETEMMVSSRPRRKRMHHLSILRKVGAPNGQMLGSRLFGPQKHTRELKRTVPLFLVEY